VLQRCSGKFDSISRVDCMQQAEAAERLARKKQKLMNMQARVGEADRHIPTLKPKHLFSGKRGIGKTERR